MVDAETNGRRMLERAIDAISDGRSVNVTLKDDLGQMAVFEVQMDGGIARLMVPDGMEVVVPIAFVELVVIGAPD